MKSKFTLIELIVVIVVLGILAAIVIPNINSYSKEAKVKAMYADARNIETAVDKFALEHNGSVPTLDHTPAVKGIPEWIELEQLDSNYLKTKPKSTQNFYLEESGHVFPLLGKLPVSYDKDVTVDGDIKFVVVFEHEEDIKNIDYINVVQVEKDKVKDIVESIKNKDLVITKKDDKFEVEISVKPPDGLTKKDLALVIVDKAKNESPIINGGVPIGGKDSNNAGNDSENNGGGNSQPDLPDTTPPTLEFSSVKNPDGTVTITVTATDNKGVSKIVKPDGTSVVGNSATYIVDKNGTYTFKAYDEANNELVKDFKVEDIMFNMNVASFSDNFGSSFILTDSGEVYAKGSNSSGQLGVGTTTAVSSWTKVNIAQKVTKIHNLADIVYFVTESGDLLATGADRFNGVTGMNVSTGTATKTTVPTKVTLPSKVKEINDWFVLLDNGNLYASGIAGSGEYGVSTGCISCIFSFKQIESNVDDVIGVSERTFSLIKKKDGKYYYAGRNPLSTPPEVYNSLTFTVAPNYSEFNYSDVKQVGGGGYSDIRLFLLNNGDVYQQVGRNTPTLLLSGVKDLFSHSDNNVFIMNNGDIYAFGTNGNGSLGLGHKNNVATPTKVESLSTLNIVKVIASTSDTNTIFVSSDNKYYISGVHSGLSINSMTPVEVDLSNFK